MEMPKILNIPDFLKVGVMAFIFITLANKALTKAGLERYKA